MLNSNFVLPPPPNPDEDLNGYSWRDWFRQLRDYVVNKGSFLWQQINFTGSKLSDIVERPHNVLQSIQGGSSVTDEYYHFTQTEHTDLTDGGDTTLHYHASDRNLANATGTLTASHGGTGLTSPGTSGNILTSNGTGWVSSAPPATGVTSFNTRTGSVTLTSSDVTTALGYTPPSSAVSSFNTRTGAVTLTAADLVAAGMASSIAATGYQQLPSGLYIQWGIATSSGTALNNWTAYFATTFPNALLWAIGTPSGSAVTGSLGIGMGSSTTSYLIGTVFNDAGTPVNAVGARYIAIGY